MSPQKPWGDSPSSDPFYLKERACQYVNQTKNMFASPQCLGYLSEHGSVTLELCLPSQQTIIKQLKRTLKSTGAKSVFVASDNDHMIEFLTQALSKFQVSLAKIII